MVTVMTRDGEVKLTNLFTAAREADTPTARQFYTARIARLLVEHDRENED